MGKLTRICQVPGCSKLLPFTRRVCDDHRGDAGRGDTSYVIRHEWQKWYSKPRWRALSKAVRAEHPFCQVCRKEGRVNRSTQVDHVVPHDGDESKFWDRGNLQALCSSCHSLKTRTERAGGTFSGRFDMDGRDEV